MQEAQDSARELADIKALSEITPTEADTELSSTAPPSMAMVLASGPIPASQDMVTAPWADSVTDTSHHTTKVQDTALASLVASEAATSAAASVAAPWDPEAPSAPNPWPQRELVAAVQGQVHHPRVPTVSDAWTSPTLRQLRNL